MIQRILQARHFFASLLAAATGMALYFRTPFPDSNLFLQVMALRGHYAFLFLQVLLHPVPLHNAIHLRIRSFFPASTFSPSRQGARFGQADCRSILNQGKGQNSLSW